MKSRRDAVNVAAARDENRREAADEDVRRIRREKRGEGRLVSEGTKKGGGGSDRDSAVQLVFRTRRVIGRLVGRKRRRQTTRLSWRQFHHENRISTNVLLFNYRVRIVDAISLS